MYKHFKAVLGGDQKEISSDIRKLINDPYVNNLSIEELDCAITDFEIKDALKNLRMGKSPGFDKIIGEMFMSDSELFVPILLTLFNFLFDNGYYPENWSDGIVISVPKKGTCQTQIIIDQSYLSVYFQNFLLIF